MCRWRRFQFERRMRLERGHRLDPHGVGLPLACQLVDFGRQLTLAAAAATAAAIAVAAVTTLDHLQLRQLLLLQILNDLALLARQLILAARHRVGGRMPVADARKIRHAQAFRSTQQRLQIRRRWNGCNLIRI